MLKYVTVLCAVAALCAGAPQRGPQDVQILRLDIDVQIDGYMVDEASDVTSGQEEGNFDSPQSEDASFTASGQYSYVGPDGEEYTVTFTDGPNGLQQSINADETSDGISGQEEGNFDSPQSEDASFSGQYSYMGPDGEEYTVTFTDGPNGLQQTINA